MSKLEKSCFPAAEAATYKALRARLQYYPKHFWLLVLDNKIISMLNGMSTDEADLSDIMYEQAALHNEQGKWQMIFGLDTAPAYRGRGWATRLLRYVISETAEQGRYGLVLTCKDALVPYYAKCGFVSEGKSKSEHGNVIWQQMRLSLKNK